MGRRDARLLQRPLDRTRETDRVRLLEVHDHDLLHLQVLDHEVRVRRALDVVTRNVPEERRSALELPCVLLRQVGASRRRREVRKPCREVRLRRRRDGARRRRPEHHQHALVRDVLLRERLCRCGALLDRRVAEDELDLQTELRSERLDRIRGPAALLGAEEAGATRHRGDERKRDRLLAVEAREGRRRDLVGALRARSHNRGRENCEGEADRLLHLGVLLAGGTMVCCRGVGADP